MKKIIIIISAALALSSCTFLDSVPTGEYTDDNVYDYPLLVRGFVDRAYDCLCKHYVSFYYAMSDGCTDNGTMRDHSSAVWQLSQGKPQYAVTYQDINMNWNDAYRGIDAANIFLKDNVGLNTRYFEDIESNDVYRRTLQGDAYGLRAWFHFMLLRHFAGKGANGEMLGIPIMTEALRDTERNEFEAKRATYDECVEQILRDCDSALVYLPLANKDFLRETNETTVCTGAIRHRKLDRITITGLKALVYLGWASPAYCPDRQKAIERYDKAARYAYEVFHHKMTLEYYQNVAGGYNPEANFLWSDAEAPEILFVSQGYYATVVENTFYPSGFYGNCEYAPSQNLVECYPMANGYPISDPRSGYDPQHPYLNRDPRFYSDIYYDESQIIRQLTGQPMYKFEIADNGKDAPGQLGSTSPTGYYIKKFTYTNYNASDAVIDGGYKSVFYMRVNQMLTTFAEAANQVVGPLDESTYGMSAKQALKYIRSKTTNVGTPGLGKNGDPYLDEVAAKGKDAFDELVRNEARIEFCWEGQRIYDLRRWGLMDKINEPIRGVSITTNANGVKEYSYPVVDTRHYPSLWLPLPYKEMRLSPLMEQNQGWEFYK